MKDQPSFPIIFGDLKTTEFARNMAERTGLGTRDPRRDRPVSRSARMSEEERAPHARGIYLVSFAFVCDTDFCAGAAMVVPSPRRPGICGTFSRSCSAEAKQYMGR